MDKLWAPWRVSYVSQIGKKKLGCLFCRLFKEKSDKKNYVFLRSKHSYAVLNIYPYNNGHVLVVPNRHVNELDKLNKEERNDLFDLLIQAKAILKKYL